MNFLTPTLSEVIRECLLFKLFSREHLTANKFQNMINVNLRSLALIFSSSLYQKYLYCVNLNGVDLSYFCKLRHRTKVLKNCREFISQEWHIRI